MKLIKIDKDNMLNGPGIRQVLWFSGCSHKCPGCHNPETWNPEVGENFTEETIQKIVSLCNNDYTSGLTLTGGDPFFPANNSEMFYFLREFKEELPNKTVWAWTGFTYEYIIQRPEMRRILDYIDILIDGKFDAEQRKLDLLRPNSRELLKYRGSSNQRIIDVAKSYAEDSIVLLDS